jgi:hypothetical protein
MAGDPKYLDGGELAELIDTSRNQEVAAYLAQHRPSCHSDTGEALIRSAEKCGEWIAFSPSFEQCRYVALITNHTVFGLGLGQRSVCYRLPGPLHASALASGAVEAGEVGPDWVRFELFRADWPAPDLPFWALRAYAIARDDHGQKDGPS